MILSTSAKALIKDNDEYIIKRIECIDFQSGNIYVKGKKKEELELVKKSSESVIKQYIITLDEEIKIENSDNTVNTIYTGDIINISRGRINNDYEAVVINGEFKGRDIKSLMTIDLKRFIEDDRMTKVLTNKHRDKKGNIRLLSLIFFYVFYKIIIIYNNSEI